MKIETVIPLRKDGTVKVTTPTGAAYLFAVDEQGRVVSEVSDEGDIGWILTLGEFFPAEDSDFDEALEITAPPPIEGDEGEAPPDDDAGDENAAPVEVPTPPKPTNKGGKKK